MAAGSLTAPGPACHNSTDMGPFLGRMSGVYDHACSRNPCFWGHADRPGWSRVGVDVLSL